MRAWRLGEKLSFGVPSLLPGDLGSHRKGAKDAKGDSHASNSKLLVDSKKLESGRFPERTTVDDLPTSWSVFLRVSVVSLGCFRMDRRLSKTTQAPKKSRARRL